jgi:hypothetical protein
MLDADLKALMKAHGIREVAFDDVRLNYDDSLSFAEWFEGIKGDKPHWIEPKAQQPGEEIFSIKAQADYVRAHGERAAHDHLAKFGLRLGLVKQRPNGVPTHSMLWV